MRSHGQMLSWSTLIGCTTELEPPRGAGAWLRIEENSRRVERTLSDRNLQTCRDSRGIDPSGLGAWLRTEDRSPVPRTGITPLDSCPASRDRSLCLRILVASWTSTRCPSNVRLRILRPMIVLYRKTVFSAMLRWLYPEDVCHSRRLSSRIDRMLRSLTSCTCTGCASDTSSVAAPVSWASRQLEATIRSHAPTPVGRRRFSRHAAPVR